MSKWKQPVPTDESDFPKEILFTLYSMLVIKSCNKDGFVTVGEKQKLIPIKRGETIFGRNKWSKYFGISPSGIEKLLKTLEIVTGKVTCIRNKNCTMVTIKDYDKVVAFEQVSEQVSNMLVTSKYQVSNTSKSVESVKSVENIISKDIKPKAGNEFVNIVLEGFEKIWGYKASSGGGQTSRQQAYNFVQKSMSYYKSKGYSEEVVKQKFPDLIDSYFAKIHRTKWGEEVVRIKPLTDNLSKFIYKESNGQVTV